MASISKRITRRDRQKRWRLHGWRNAGMLNAAGVTDAKMKGRLRR